MQPEWLACATDSDCTYLTYNCSEHVAVNKAYTGPAQQALCSIGVGVSCAWEKCPLLTSPIVVCGDQHQCITKWAPGNRSVPITKPVMRH
jgi:hypothetical protein